MVTGTSKLVSSLDEVCPKSFILNRAVLLKLISTFQIQEAKNEFDHYDRERRRIRGSLENDLPQLIKLLPMTLATSRDVVVS